MDRRLLSRWLRYYALFRPLALLPAPSAYRAAAAIGRREGLHSLAMRQTVAAGMRQLFPAADEKEMERWLDNHFAMLARETLDVFVMPRLTPANSRPLLRLAPGALTLLQDAKADGRGLIIAMSHYGRVNMLLLALGLAGQRLGMLTMVTDRRNPHLDPVERRYLQRKIHTLLGFIKGRWVTLGEDMRVLYRALEQGETMVLLLDSFTPERSQKKLAAPFFGGHLSVTRGIARLAERTGARVVYGVAQEHCWQVEAVLRPLPEQPEAALVMAVQELERDVRATPWQWWHWNILGAVWSPAQAGM